MALSASCTAICTIVKTRVCCGGPPADPTTALALAFQSMTGSAMATPGNAKATAAASSQRLGIGKLEACARTEEGFIRGLLREIQRDGPTSAGGPTGAIAVLGENGGGYGRRPGKLQAHAGRRPGALQCSVGQNAIWPRFFAKSGACWAHARECQHHPSRSGMEDACGLSDHRAARRRGTRRARR